MQRIITLMAAAAVATAAVPAWAQMEQVSVKVSYADLDLDRAAGRKALDRRIAQAVERICPDESHLQVVRVRQMRECRARAMASIQPQLAALYSGGARAHASVEIHTAP